MMLTTFTLFIALLFPCIILLSAMLVSSRSFQDREKMSPFECGFDPKTSARIPFSLRFFLLAVIFLVFDIEIALLMPLPIMALNNLNMQLMFGSFIFILILIGGLMHEWREGSLDWSK